MTLKTFVNVPHLKTEIVFVTCTEYKGCRPYSEILTYKPLTNNKVKNMAKKVRDKSNK
jgi:hypothetical protein